MYLLEVVQYLNIFVIWRIKMWVKEIIKELGNISMSGSINSIYEFFRKVSLKWMKSWTHVLHVGKNVFSGVS